MKRKSISKYSNKDQDAIINIQPGAKAILYELKEEDMTTNQKLDLILNKLDNHDTKFDEVFNRLEAIETKVDRNSDDINELKINQQRMLNTPTMKKELKNNP